VLFVTVGCAAPPGVTLLYTVGVADKLFAAGRPPMELFVRLAADWNLEEKDWAATPPVRALAAAVAAMTAGEPLPNGAVVDLPMDAAGPYAAVMLLQEPGIRAEMTVQDWEIQIWSAALLTEPEAVYARREGAVALLERFEAAGLPLAAPQHRASAV
jgi:Suppressor of fused protein (SUFU)